MFKDSVRKKLCSRFFVTPGVGHNFSGVLVSTCKNYHVFGDVKVHPPESEPQPAVGELYIDRKNVAYMQLIPC